MPNFAVIDNELVTNVFVADSIEVVRIIMPNASLVVEEDENTGVAAVGGFYKNGKFTFASPYSSWIFNEATLEWEAPVTRPEAQEGEFYDWDEDTVSWVKLSIPESSALPE